MCPTCDVLPAENGDVVQVPLTNGTNGVHANGVRTTNEKRGSTRSNPPRTDQRNPYAPRASDFLSNISNFNIIESTLRGLSFSISNLCPSHLKLRGRAVR